MISRLSERQVTLMLQRLLILTNMGPKPSAPFQGVFVRNQVAALAALKPAYFQMEWQSDRMPWRLLRYPIFWLQFVWRFVFSRQKFDILHVHFFYPTIWLALTYRYLRNPEAKIVVTCHGSDVYAYDPPSRWYQRAAAQVDQWIFVSEQLRRRFFRQDIKAEVLPAGIHALFGGVQALAPAVKDIDVLYVGTLDFNKGMDRLIALLPALDGKKVVVIGHGPWHEQLQAAASHYPQLQLVAAQGAEQLKNYYQRSRVFVSLSRNESFGLVMTEAMACGTPVVATVTDGSTMQVRDGENGYLVSADTEQVLVTRLAEKIQLLLSLPAADYQQLQHSCQTSAEPYLLDKIADRLTAIYQRLDPVAVASPE